jgi:alpha,alpha-trehalose phosphorylase
MRDHDGGLSFAPRLPAQLKRIAFRLLFRGRRLKVEITNTKTVYTLLDGNPLEIVHHGETIGLSPHEPVAQPAIPVVERPTPSQPPGRAPSRRATRVEAR